MIGKKKEKENGYLMLLTAIIFMMLSTIIVFGLAMPIIKQIFTSRDIWAAKQGYYYAESGTEDLLYRVNDATYSSHVGSSENTLFDASTTIVTTISTTTNGENLQSIINSSGYEKHIQVNLQKGTVISFPYAVQSGDGGVDLNNTSYVQGGDVFAIRNFWEDTSGNVTGNVTVANPSTLFLDQANDIPSSPSNDINFGNVSTSTDFAQSFQISSTSPLTVASVYIKKVGNPTVAPTLKIVKNYHNANYDSPSATTSDTLASIIIPIASTTPSYQWIDANFTSPGLSLAKNTTYWLVLDNSNTSTANYFSIEANLDNYYPLGTSKVGNLSTGNSWLAKNLDGFFRITLGDYYAIAQGVGGNASVGGDVSSHVANFIDGTLAIKCQVGYSNNQSCDTSNPDPGLIPNPISDTQILKWEAEATAGGILNGNQTVGTQTLGPVKIVGNLTINQSSTLTLTGAVYVTGKVDLGTNVLLQSGTKIKLDPSFGNNSGVLIANGQVNLGRLSSLQGSGQSGSYLFVISTSSCPTGSCSSFFVLWPVTSSIIGISLDTSRSALYAPNGEIDLTGVLGKASSANAVYADAIKLGGTGSGGLGGNSNVVYYTDLIAPSFISGTTRTIYSISDWKELNQ